MAAYFNSYTCSEASSWDAKSVISLFAFVAGVLAYLSRRKEAMGTEEMPEEIDDATSKDTAGF